MIFILIIFILTQPIQAVDSSFKSKLTDREIEFIENHPIITMGTDPHFVPFEFIDSKGEYKGITADYLEIISEKTGLEFKRLTDLSWVEAYEKGVNKEVDILPAVAKTEARAEIFLYSDPYYHFKRIIVTRDDNQEIKNIDDLKGKMVAVQKNSSHHSYLMEFPQINISLYESVENAVTAVSTGSEEAFIGNLASTNYLIQNTALTNLKFIAFEAENQFGIHFAVRDDWPELQSILNKALASIPEAEKNAINSSWVTTKIDYDYSGIVRIIILIAIIVLIILAVSSFWIYRLKKEVKKRKIIQKDLEKAKSKAERLQAEAEKANMIKSSFLARMSHEIRTPLNAITGISYLLKQSKLNLSQTKHVEKIINAANNMLGIINDILDYSKIESGRIEIEETSFNLDQLVDEIINIVSYKIEENEIDFTFIKDPRLPSYYIGDSRRIKQIILNLLNNAVKFTANGEIKFELRKLAANSQTANLEIIVEDSGIGMNEKELEKLFKPFSQVDASINRRFGGTGLGLSIVKNLVEMMGGKIEVYSTKGEGSTFLIRFALKIDQEKEKDYQQQLSYFHFNDLRALVLEKRSNNLNIIKNYLNSYGITTELSTSELSTVKMLKAADKNFARSFDLLIIDYNTPENNAFEFVRKLKQDVLINKLPKMILVVPMEREDLLTEIEGSDFEIAVTRPIIPSVLLNSILELFKFKAVMSSERNINKFKSTSDDQKKEIRSKFAILLVEDNSTNQMIAVNLLESAGYRIITADDGQQAVEIFKNKIEKIDLILMDLHMPVKNGYQAAAEINDISEVPIIAMSADVIEGVKERCRKAGIFEYISKPFVPEDLINKVDQILDLDNYKNEKYQSKNSKKQQKDSTAIKQDEKIADLEKGLENLGVDKKTYKEILKSYHQENKDLAEKMRKLVENNQYKEAADIVHKFKSSTGSIGASKLYQLAVNLQKALENENYDQIKSLESKFEEKLELLLEMIKNYQ